MSIIAQDSNTTQLHSFYVKQDTFPFTQFIPPFKWIPPIGFIGNHPVLFKVTDTDSPTYFDTQTVTISVSASIDTQPGIVDTIGPKITKISGPATNTRTANPNDTLVYSITDPSGVDTVSWTLNSGVSTVLLPDANGHYTIWAVLSTYHSNKIVIAASDKSSSHNKSADTTILDYNVAPKANNQNLSTKKNAALSITLTADPIDGDSLLGWTVVTPPANGALSGTAPILTYTPQTGFLGSDSLTFTVSDGKNTSNVGKIKINVSDVLVAPVAGKTIADIAVNKGQPASFAATVNADANPTPMFSWFKEGGSTSISAIQTYTISQTSYTDQGRYHYIVSNSQGTDTSNWITLTVKDVTKPVIVLKGANPQSIMVGGKYTELGDSAYDDKDGIITSKVVIDTSKVKLAQIGTYQVTYSVKDSAGNADTVTRSVQINGNAPVIGTISGNKETCINVAAVFSVSATGSQPLKYQWMKGTAAAPGNSTDSIYSITPLSIADAGSFYCVVSNGISPDAQSQNMTLIVDSPPAISSITASPSTMPVCSGSQVAFAVTATGTAPLTYSWKKNGSAIATAPNSATYTISAVAVSDSGQYSCAVSNGCTPSAMSSNVHLTVTMPPTISAPAANTTISKIVGDTVTLTVTASGTGTLSYQWYKGSTTVGTNSASFPIKPIAFTDSGAYTCAVTNGCGPTNSKTIVLKVNAIPITITSIAAGNYHSLILKSDGRLFGCGSNGIGQLGLGYTADQSSPILIMSGVQSIAAGTNYSLILKTGGILYACGYNGSGQLGDGTTTERHSPVQIMTGVQSFAAGGHSLILKTDGTLFACGGNFFGQFGDGSTNSDSVPKQIMTGVKSVSASIYHSLILKTDGTLFACGRNSNGQLGDGTTKNDSVPLQIMADVQSVAAGENFSLILKTDGTLLACGDNLNGDLGDGTGIERHTPVQIMTGVKAIAAGASHSLILKTNGTLYACGNNSNGQLGNGNTSNQNSPIQIMTGVQSISAGVGHSLILKTDGTLYSCGFNSNGQLGDGTTIDKDSPVNITF